MEISDMPIGSPIDDGRGCPLGPLFKRLPHGDSSYNRRYYHNYSKETRCFQFFEKHSFENDDRAGIYRSGCDQMDDPFTSPTFPQRHLSSEFPAGTAMGQRLITA